jgi:hypothetical protein
MEGGGEGFSCPVPSCACMRHTHTPGSRIIRHLHPRIGFLTHGRGECDHGPQGQRRRGAGEGVDLCQHAAVCRTLAAPVVIACCSPCVRDHASQSFRNPDELWQQTQDGDGSHATWYQKAVSYWDQQEASYNGVLGGFGHVSEADVRDSKQLIEKVSKAAAACTPARQSCLSCPPSHPPFPSPSHPFLSASLVAVDEDSIGGECGGNSDACGTR